MTAKTWVLCFWGYGKCCSNGEFFQLPYEAGSILSIALFFHLVCSSAAVELVAVKQDGIYIRLRNCTCCLRFPCRTASNYTALVWSCRVLSSNQPTSPEYIMAAAPLSSDCHMPAWNLPPVHSHPQINKSFCLAEGFQDQLPRQVGWPVCTIS